MTLYQAQDGVFVGRPPCANCGANYHLHHPDVDASGEQYLMRCPEPYRPGTLEIARRELEEANRTGDNARIFTARGNVQELERRAIAEGQRSRGRSKFAGEEVVAELGLAGISGSLAHWKPIGTATVNTRGMAVWPPVPIGTGWAVVSGRLRPVGGSGQWAEVDLQREEFHANGEYTLIAVVDPEESQ